MHIIHFISILSSESETSYKERLRIQDNIYFGGQVKKFVNHEFVKREGYNESFLDSLPIIREITEDFQPPR